jgi:hypothetical protein
LETQILLNYYNKSIPAEFLYTQTKKAENHKHKISADCYESKNAQHSVELFLQTKNPKIKRQPFH